MGSEPFAVLLGDTLVDSRTPVTRQLIAEYERYRESVVALEEVDRAKVSRYGVIKGKPVQDGLYLIEDFVEKPTVAEAPSNLAIAGRYVFSPEIFQYIDKTAPGKNNEIQITDAMRLMVRNRAMYGLRFEGTRYDIGNKFDFLRTNLIYGLKHRELSKDLQELIKQLAAQQK